MNAPVCPPFEDALEQFRAFLAQEGLATDILWVFRDDVVERPPDIFVTSQIENSVRFVEQLYRFGQEVGLGINLAVYCVLDNRPCCYIWLPKDFEDACYRMLNGLKLSIPTGNSRRKSEVVESQLQWTELKSLELQDRSTKWADEIPNHPQPQG